MLEKFSYQEIFKIDDKNIKYEKVFPFEGELVSLKKKKIFIYKRKQPTKIFKVSLLQYFTLP